MVFKVEKFWGQAALAQTLSIIINVLTCAINLKESADKDWRDQPLGSASHFSLQTGVAQWPCTSREFLPGIVIGVRTRIV